MQTIDWIILVVYLAGSFAVGMLGRHYVKDIVHYIVAGRSLGPHLGVATLAATEIGTITFMIYAELGYQTGFAALATALCAGITMIYVGQTGLIVKRLRALNIMTIPEFFEEKYGANLRVLTGILVAVAGLLNMGFFLKIEGQFLTILCGIPEHYLVWTMAGVLLLEMTYTALGGMVSVVITDFLQYALLSTATVLVSAFVVYQVGWGNMVTEVAKEYSVGGFDPFQNPTIGPVFLIWQLVFWTAVHTCWQTTAMRAFAMKSPETSMRVLRWTGFIFLGRGMLPLLWGVAAFTYFKMKGVVHEPILAMPHMLSELLPVGIKGFVVAGMLAATMSVNSSYLLSWSTVISQDVLMPIRRMSGKPALSSQSQIRWNQWTNVFVSLFLMLWGLFMKLPGTAYVYVGMTGNMYLSGAFVAIIGALYWKRTTKWGCFMALAGGALGTIIPYFFTNSPQNWIGFLAFVMAVMGLVIGSVAEEANTKRRQLV